LPSESVRLFSPHRGLPQFDFRFGIHGDLERFRVILRFGMNRMDIVEDRIGFGRLLQRLSFLNPLEPIVHSIEETLRQGQRQS